MPRSANSESPESCPGKYGSLPSDRSQSGNIIDISIDEGQIVHLSRRETEVGDTSPEGTRLIQTDTNKKEATMNLNFNSTQHDENLQTVATQARSLMSANRQRVQQRQQAMRTRVAAEVGVDA